MSGYRWTVEEAADLAASMLQFNIEADAEMAAQGYRPGAGLPFEGMPAELFPHDPDLDDPRWADEDDLPDHSGQPDYSGPPEEAGRPGAGLDASRGYPYGVAAGPGGAGEAMGRVIDALERVERGIAGLMGDRVVLFEQARVLGLTGDERSRAGSRQLALRSLRAELGAALRIPERTIDAFLGVSHILVHELPATLEALRSGTISFGHARVMVDFASGLPGEARAVLEGQALPHAARLTVAKFKQKARILTELLDPESITQRHARAREDREVRLDPQQDGLALLSQLLPAPEAIAIFNRLTDAATALQGPTEVRTLAQLRADIFSEVMLDGTNTVSSAGTSNADDRPLDTVARRTRRTRRARRAATRRNRAVRVALTRAGWSGIRGGGSLRDRYFQTRPRLSVTVPALVLLGLSEEPGSLDGYGPIDANTARLLAAGAPSMIRLLTHPETGAILSIGRDRYRVPADLRAFLRVRDETCRFPGCSRQAELCDIDHTLQWQHQHPTAHYNLAHLCRLCRYRHKGHYSDVRIMPMLTVEPLSLLASGWMLSA
ncbi:hypothetical protein ABIB15_002038 [Marisediminicola sp. UYEF4]|uniref:HNH endonuclease n=1 Tax=Marisediminicola sp. UYEF4 TaxID=1756384 RepID=UPI0033998957